MVQHCQWKEASHHATKGKSALEALFTQVVEGQEWSNPIQEVMQGTAIALEHVVVTLGSQVA